MRASDGFRGARAHERAQRLVDGHPVRSGGHRRDPGESKSSALRVRWRAPVDALPDSGLLLVRHGRHAQRFVFGYEHGHGRMDAQRPEPRQSTLGLHHQCTNWPRGLLGVQMGIQGATSALRERRSL
ncbi:unnamed protein product [Polarella glacialis]|uniref:Uncharacterized protein n=1 Tax=Polarella glacialis TaxID=89957 RepID=A0A813GHB2_POLGL|nr:unnamed protein product [Polarella glacialis]CAE8674060.1 unnamed protein product [Polarella glacialis]